MPHLYAAVQACADLRMPGISVAEIFERAFRGSKSDLLRNFGAACSVLTRLNVTHTRPSFGISGIEVKGKKIKVTEEVLLDDPWCSLLHFKKDTSNLGPRVLIVAPLSGHFATLVRPTVRALLPDCDVFVTDWKNARDIPLLVGACSFDDNIALLIRFMEFLGSDLHVIAVCQSSVTVSAAISILSDGMPHAAPRSMILIAGPIDTRISPTRVNLLAKTYPIEWFEQAVTTWVPFHLPGGLRRVYPGHIQLGNFMSMNLEKHMGAHIDLLVHTAVGDEERAKPIRDFYEEYHAVMDLPAEFYLETVKLIFQEHRLPEDTLTWRGHPVKPRAVTKTALMTIEGERDDICGVGQTEAAHKLFKMIPSGRRRHHLQEGAGHYGTFSGRRFRKEILPKVVTFIMKQDLAA